MYSINFEKNGVTKNTFTAWGLVPSEDFVIRPDCTIRFLMRFGDVSIDARAKDIEEFLTDINIVSYTAGQPYDKFKGNWKVEKKEQTGNGVFFDFSYQEPIRSTGKKEKIEETEDAEEFKME